MSRELARLLNVHEQRARGILIDLWAWGTSLGPKDGPPTGICAPGLATERLAGAVLWEGEPGALACALEAVGALEVSGRHDNSIRVKGVDRYARTWEKDARRRVVVLEGNPPEPEPLVRLKTPEERAVYQAEEAERLRIHREAMAQVKAKRALRFVYFVQSGTTGPVKIGYSKNPAGRLAQLQVGHPEPLRLLAQVVGDKARERELHERFAEHRLEGEWFKPATELLEHIEACRRPPEDR